jgi:hypothetical protein
MGHLCDKRAILAERNDIYAIKGPLLAERTWWKSRKFIILPRTTTIQRGRGSLLKSIVDRLRTHAQVLCQITGRCFVFVVDTDPKQFLQKCSTNLSFYPHSSHNTKKATTSLLLLHFASGFLIEAFTKMVRMALILTATLATVANGFTTLPTSRDVSSRVFHSSTPSIAPATQPLHMVATSSDNFDEENSSLGRRASRKGKSADNVEISDAAASKFVVGDKLHRLRHEVLAMRLELQEARRSGSKEKIRDLERAIMKAQQVDAEFVYTVSLERMELAQQEGRFQDAEKYRYLAYDARDALPHFNLEGLWVGKYGDHGYEMINVTYHGDTLIANKVTGTKNVPKGQATFEVDLSPSMVDGTDELLEPIELGDNAARQWGCKYLQRFGGRGQVAAEGYQDSQWIDGQLIMVNEYFSFAWLPIGHQVFFGRPTPELILKLMKDEKRRETGDCSERAYLEKCWEETEHLEDDHEVSFSSTSSTPSDNDQNNNYFFEEGSFE